MLRYTRTVQVYMAYIDVYTTAVCKCTVLRDEYINQSPRRCCSVWIAVYSYYGCTGTIPVLSTVLSTAYTNTYTGTVLVQYSYSRPSRTGVIAVQCIFR